MLIPWRVSFIIKYQCNLSNLLFWDHDLNKVFLISFGEGIKRMGFTCKQSMFSFFIFFFKGTSPKTNSWKRTIFPLRRNIIGFKMLVFGGVNLVVGVKLPSLKANTAPENGWLEDDRFLLGYHLVRCY